MLVAFAFTLLREGERSQWWQCSFCRICCYIVDGISMLRTVASASSSEACKMYCANRDEQGTQLLAM